MSNPTVINFAEALKRRQERVSTPATPEMLIGPKNNHPKGYCDCKTPCNPWRDGIDGAWLKVEPAAPIQAAPAAPKLAVVQPLMAHRNCVAVEPF